MESLTWRGSRLLPDSLMNPSPEMSSGVEDTGEWVRAVSAWTGMVTSGRGALWCWRLGGCWSRRGRENFAAWQR